MTNKLPITRGCHHIGLTVANLGESAHFFTGVLGWSEVRRDPEYPAVFITDGTLMITLWQVKSDSPGQFDRKQNIGLHHLALQVEDFARLDAIHEKLKAANIKIEFSPQSLRDGPAKHMMCYEPGGIRIEFICIPKETD